MSYNNYKTYDSVQSTNYLYHMILLGLLSTSTVQGNISEHAKVGKNIYIKSQSSFIPSVSELTSEKGNIELLDFVKNSLSHIENAQFDFLDVDEDLNNDINKYISSYSGKNKEILEF
ncbi:hypothetical protein [Arcobacter sp. s6]|uniref:hypothetical protein n=1 Tax=Arcobacter sp. s6 TaxID=3230363 RepID=UPI0034A0A261